MPSWGEILREIANKEIVWAKKVEQGENLPHPCDVVRREYLMKLHKYTGRNTIVYATSWTQAHQIPPEYITITEEDIQGFMEAIYGLEGKELDLILHSPGGQPSATEALVTYLRKKFDDIRVIVPQAAMSAATMLACAANKIIMGKHSSLGPVDPQLILDTPLGRRSVPAGAILDQFGWAKYECEGNQESLGIWVPILQQYGPALLIEANNAIELSQQLVNKWLREYMFKDIEDGEKLAEAISKKLSDHRYFKSHSRHISIDEARELGLLVEELENDQKFQDLVLSVFHATTITFDLTAAVKIIENHEGRAFIKLYGHPKQDE
ncbi:SDH family Clp fold serine proteinase [Archaeoglobus veneficus]|uniref:Serine protease n=1 Tax=Archaeoglobus veneficus (strain DSM 11195 / SNP6) TaxID=693661 RepID=F2KSP8_ARCVS|nr:hypothetical protein [Archaeoglobus veneficus]AEA48118.1 protein of unknown function DUF114 [Archaeoglobus veneficus SNP6]